MSTVVSQASVVRAPTHSQAGGQRSPAGAEEPESPFAELLDGCVTSETEAPADAPKAAESAESTPPETKPQPDTPKTPEPAQGLVESDNAEKLSAELTLLLALTGQPVAAGGKEGKPAEGKPVEAKATPDIPSEEPAVKESQPADADLLQVSASPVVDPAVAPPVPVPPAVAPVVPLAVPGEAALEHVTLPEKAALDMPAAVGSPTHPAVSAAKPDKNEEPETIAAVDMTPPPGKPADSTDEATPQKPTSAASERTLETPAAFRAAADTDKPPEKSELLARENPDPPKNEAATTKPHHDVEAPETKPKMAALPQPSPEAPANAPTLPASLPPSTGPHQITQPAGIQSVPADRVPVAGLAVEIALHAQAGKNHFEIRLDPPELGRIDVRLDVGSDGQVTSHLRVERAETLDLLRRDAPTLERALQQAGLKTSDNGLQFSLRDQSFSWQQQQDRDMPDMARIVVPDETLPAVEGPRNYGRLAGLGSGVDIRV